MSFVLLGLLILNMTRSSFRVLHNLGIAITRADKKVYVPMLIAMFLVTFTLIYTIALHYTVKKKLADNEKKRTLSNKEAVTYSILTRPWISPYTVTYIGLANAIALVCCIVTIATMIFQKLRPVTDTTASPPTMEAAGVVALIVLTSSLIITNIYFLVKYSKMPGKKVFRELNKDIYNNIAKNSTVAPVLRAMSTAGSEQGYVTSPVVIKVAELFQSPNISSDTDTLGRVLFGVNLQNHLLRQTRDERQRQEIQALFSPSRMMIRNLFNPLDYLNAVNGTVIDRSSSIVNDIIRIANLTPLDQMYKMLIEAQHKCQALTVDINNKIGKASSFEVAQAKYNSLINMLLILQSIPFIALFVIMLGFGPFAEMKLAILERRQD
jgi:hypothetical protein